MSTPCVTIRKAHVAEQKSDMLTNRKMTKGTIRKWHVDVYRDIAHPYQVPTCVTTNWQHVDKYRGDTGHKLVATQGEAQQGHVDMCDEATCQNQAATCGNTV